MFGIEGTSVALAYGLCLASAALCLIYGAVNFNRGGDEAPKREEVAWRQSEKEVEKPFEP